MNFHPYDVVDDDKATLTADQISDMILAARVVKKQKFWE